MISLTGSSTPQDAAGAFAILQVISDPVKCKARLDELTKIATDADAALLQASDRLAAAQKLEKELARGKAELEKGMAEVALMREVLKTERAALNHERSALAKQDNENRLAVANFVKTRDETLHDLANRERAIATREQKARETLEAAEALQTEYNAKLNQLKAIAA